MEIFGKNFFTPAIDCRILSLARQNLPSGEVCLLGVLTDSVRLKAIHTSSSH